MQDRPTVDELLNAVADFLTNEIVPNTQGRRQFLARVSANSLRLISRELAHEQDHAATEWEVLDSLLDGASMPAGREDRRTATQARLEDLAGRIRSGAFDEEPGRTELLTGLRRIVRDKLEVTNQGYLEADAERDAE